MWWMWWKFHCHMVFMRVPQRSVWSTESMCTHDSKSVPRSVSLGTPHPQGLQAIIWGSFHSTTQKTLTCLKSFKELWSMNVYDNIVTIWMWQSDTTNRPVWIRHLDLDSEFAPYIAPGSRKGLKLDWWYRWVGLVILVSMRYPLAICYIAMERSTHF